MIPKIITPSPDGSSDIFATTRWTVVLAAGRQTAQSAAALEKLCATYWFPLYAYIRRRGYSKEDAEDLTQAFFAALLSKKQLGELSAERGRFRAFLLAALKHYLANEWDRSIRQKRGGGATHLSLDWHSADAQFQVAAATELAPDRTFDREWAVALLATVIERLGAECAATGRGRQFEELKVFLTDKSAIPHAVAAAALGIDEGAARVAVHRLRKRYREVLRDEIAQTLSDRSQVDEEMRALFLSFAG